jgi:tetratricopeptide (TPR) repeat protein
MLAHRQADLARARSLHEEQLRIYRELGAPYTLPGLLNHLGQIAFDQTDDDASRSFFEEGVRIARAAPHHRFDLALALCGLGDVARRRGDYAGARSFYQECGPIFHELGYLLGAVHSLNALGQGARLAGDFGAARAFLRESLTLLKEWRDAARTIECLEELAELLAAEGHREPAARQLAAAEVLREEAGHDPRPTPGHPRYPRTPPEALARRLREAFPAAWAAGRALPLEDALRAAWRSTGETGR